jgi:hypothetical protein
MFHHRPVRVRAMHSIIEGMEENCRAAHSMPISNQRGKPSSVRSEIFAEFSSEQFSRPARATDSPNTS